MNKFFTAVKEKVAPSKPNRIVMFHGGIIFVFLGMCDAVLCVAPNIWLCVIGGALVNVLAMITWFRLWRF